MIDNLRDLNRIVNNTVNYIVKTACEGTEDGNFSLSVENVASTNGLEHNDMQKYLEFIVAELKTRPEIIDASMPDTVFDAFKIICSRRYCPSCKLQEDNKHALGKSGEEQEAFSVMPITQPLDMVRMSEIGTACVHAAITTKQDLAKAFFQEKVCVTDEELARLGFDTKQTLDLEKIELPVFVEEIEPKSNYNDDLDLIIEQLENEDVLKQYSEPYTQVLLNENVEPTTNSELPGNEEDTVRLSDLSASLIEAAKEKVVSDLLQHDYQYQVYKSTNDPRLDEYIETYKEICLAFFPRSGEHFIIQSNSHSLDNGRACTIVEPTVTNNVFAFKVLFDTADVLKTENKGFDSVVRYEDLIPYRENNLSIGRWRVRLVFPGELFGENNSVINNNETLIEFWDMCSLKKAKMAKARVHGDWQNRRMSIEFGVKQGYLAGGRYSLPNLLSGYQDCFEQNGAKEVRGLCLNGSVTDSLIVSAQEMSKILRWLKYRPAKEAVIYEVQGEAEVPLKYGRNQEEVSDYIQKKLSSVYNAFEISTGRFGVSDVSSNIEFSFKTSLKESGIESIVKMILAECEVTVNIHCA